MKYKILSRLKITSKFKTKDLIELILINRGIKTKKEKELFLNPKLSEVTIESSGISIKEVEKAKKRVKKAIENKEEIVVFGDYDVDGICGTAILWETLNKMGAKVMPYIPHRLSEGYGLSEKGIKNVKTQTKNIKLIITVDNGSVAKEAVDFANKEGIDVIITDHHTFSSTRPNSIATVHSTNICGAAVAWLFSRALGSKDESHLELAAIATVADLVPLTNLNRIIVKQGIEKIKNTKRIGLLELFYEAGLEASGIGSYEIGHIISPRINAMGRMEYAMDSLRLLCTRDRIRAKELARKISETNRKRQVLTIDTTTEVINKVRKTIGNKKIIFIGDEEYNQGIIGLVAGKLVEEFYLPAIVVSKGKTLSKASARSIKGFNIVEFIRDCSDFLIDVGGHPMAAGFTVETGKIFLVKKKMEKLAEKMITADLLSKEMVIDSEISLQIINLELIAELEKLAPFGPANPTPGFLTKNLIIDSMRLVGSDGRHLKLSLRDSKTETKIEAIAFNLGKKAEELKAEDRVDVVYTISVNEWNGNRSPQLKIKDLLKAS